MKKQRQRTFYIDHNDIAFKRYLRDINRYPLLTEEEAASLPRVIKSGGPDAAEARERFINANLRYVVSVAKSYDYGIVPLMDLISEGNLGLMQAVDTYDASLGYKFTSYADPVIRHAIEDALGDLNSVVHLPSGQRQTVREYNRMNDEMMQLHQRPITLDEFCEATGSKPYTMAKAMAATQGHISLDTVIRHDDDDDGGCTLGDYQKAPERSDDMLICESNSIEIQDFIRNVLADREILVINNLYGLSGDTYFLDGIADRLGVSVERVRQIEKSALIKLKATPHADCLRVLWAA